MSNLVCLPWPSWTCSISNPVTAYELAVWMILPVTAAGALAPLPPIPLTKTDRNSPGGVMWSRRRVLVRREAEGVDSMLRPKGEAFIQCRLRGGCAASWSCGSKQPISA